MCFPTVNPALLTRMTQKHVDVNEEKDIYTYLDKYIVISQSQFSHADVWQV